MNDEDKKRNVDGIFLLLSVFPAVNVLAAAKVVVIPLMKNDPNLLPDNIKCGITISGVTGTLTWIPLTVCSSGQVWMDRNLGASQVAIGMTDVLAYGDLYQWGRLADGH